MRITLGALAVFVGISAMPMSASALCLGPTSDDCERLFIQKAETARAKAVGGYDDPLTALSRLFSGEVDQNQVFPPITTYREAEDWLPGGKYLDGAGALRPEFAYLAG